MDPISIFDLSHAEIEAIREKGEALKTEDAREWLKAFFEKRKYEFKGK